MAALEFNLKTKKLENKAVDVSIISSELALQLNAIIRLWPNSLVLQRIDNYFVTAEIEGKGEREIWGSFTMVTSWRGPNYSTVIDWARHLRRTDDNTLWMDGSHRRSRTSLLIFPPFSRGGMISRFIDTTLMKLTPSLTPSQSVT
jgi:hypothetical protein